jgi:hypothetical protein
MEFFAEKKSIVREIWGTSDTVLFIFAGAAAEFALNKAVDWLYYTGKLPSDPLARLFSTVAYARKIVFSTTDEANKAIDTIRQIHTSVEQSRGHSIPDWAYRDVLFMLIDYSIVSYELLERKLSEAEKEEVYNVFYRVGIRMGLKMLPPIYVEWLPVRVSHLKENLQKSRYTNDLFAQYKKHLGALRYTFLLQAQKLMVPQHVKNLMCLGNYSWLMPLISIYKISKRIRIDRPLKNLLLPRAYKDQINALDINSD